MMKNRNVVLLLTLVALAIAGTLHAATPAHAPAPDASTATRGAGIVAAADDGDLAAFDDEDGAPGGDEIAGGGGRHGHMGPGGPGARFGMVAQQLDLTDSQRERLRDIHEHQMRRDIQARADLQLARLDLHKMMSAERPEVGEINAQIDKLARLRAAQAKEHVASLLEARATLTPEQLKKARALRSGRGPGAMGGEQGRRGSGMRGGWRDRPHGEGDAPDHGAQ